MITITLTGILHTREDERCTHQLSKDGLRQVGKEMVKRHRCDDATLGVRNEHDFG